MNKLILEGKFVLRDGKKYISYPTMSKSYLLPIVADGVFKEGEHVYFEGVLRTRNVWRDDGKSHKMWFGEGQLNSSRGGCFQNSFTTNGTVVRIFEPRITPVSKRKIVDCIVAYEDNYYNCILFGCDADRFVATKKVGSPISISCSLFQSRDYVKNGETKTAYEVCIRKFI